MSTFPTESGAVAESGAVTESGRQRDTIPGRDRCRIADPAALGLLSLASTTFLLGMYSVSTRHITHPNAIVGMAFFVGGLVQLLAGMWEFPRRNVFGATAFSIYGAFWLSFATILLPGSGIFVAYNTESELRSALGIFLITWFMVMVFLLIGSLKRNITYISIYFFLMLTFLLLAIGQFSNRSSVTKAGGAFAIVAGLFAFYGGISHLLVPEARFFELPLGDVGKRQDA